MKRAAVLLMVAIVVGGAVWYCRRHPELRVGERVSAFFKPLRDLRDDLFPPAFTPPPRSASTRPARGPAPTRPKPPSHRPPRAASLPAPSFIPNGVTLFLRNGGSVSGSLVRETPREIVLRWEYGEAAFARSEVERMVRGVNDRDGDHITMPWEGEGEHPRWPYQHDVVLKLTNGTVLDAEIATVTPEQVHVTRRLPAGGLIEQAVARPQIEHLLFRPLRNARSQAIEQRLRTLFPAMRWETEGLFTIVTDSAPPTVKTYRRAIQDLTSDWYLTFAPLVRGRTPMVQQYIVIFENWESYMEYALTDGVPGWVAVGYFQPEDEVLYCFNMVGERFSGLLEQAYLGQLREVRDQMVAQVKGSRYAIFVEGQMSEFLQKLEQAHAIVRQVFQRLSVEVLRHELTHALFHDWRLQTVILTQWLGADAAQTEQKSRYLRATDLQEKRRLLDTLLAQKGLPSAPDVQATNAWFVEGLAGFMEPSPVGSVNQQRLADLQAGRRTRQLLPLEFLHTFRLGSFSGMSSENQLYAYAQSWALCHFLLSRYRDGFLSYLDRVAREAVDRASSSNPPTSSDAFPPAQATSSQEDHTLAWLLEAVGKPAHELDEEFSRYLDQFPQEDPFWLRQMQIFLDLRSELLALGNRLGAGG